MQKVMMVCQPETAEKLWAPVCECSSGRSSEAAVWGRAGRKKINLSQPCNVVVDASVRSEDGDDTSATGRSDEVYST